MNTGPARPTTAIDYITLSSTRRMADHRSTVSCDRVNTSDRALLLSRNLPALRQQLSPRPDVLQKFSTMSSDLPIEVDDHTLNNLFSKMGLETPGS